MFLVISAGSYVGDALHGPSAGQQGVNAIAAPSPQVAPSCDQLLAKLKRQKRSRSHATTHRKQDVESKEPDSELEVN